MNTGQNRIIAQIVITIIVVSSNQARSKSMVNLMLFVFRSSPNPSLTSESALCPPNPSSSSITTPAQCLIRSSVAVNLPSYRSLRPSVATIILLVTDLSSFRCWTSGIEDTYGGVLFLAATCRALRGTRKPGCAFKKIFSVYTAGSLKG